MHRLTTAFLLSQVGLAHAGPKARAPELDFALTEMTSGYGQDKADAGMSRAKPAFAACYGARLAKQPELAGTVHVYFRIIESGSATDTLAGGLDEALQQCIVDAIGKVAFAKPAKPVTVQYELHLGHSTAPNVDMRLPYVSNGYARKAVVDVVDRARPALLGCYTAHPARAGVSGSLSLIFEIAGDGSVQHKEGKAIALSQDHELDSCITDVITKLAFAGPATAPVEVHYVMMFRK